MWQGFIEQSKYCQRSLSAWLYIPLSTLIDVAVPAADPSTFLSVRIAMVLERKPELATLFNEIVDQIDAGNMSNEDLDEVVRYAAYRLNLASMRSSNERSGSELPQKNG